MQSFTANDMQAVYNHVGFSDKELLTFLIGEKAEELFAEIKGNIGTLFSRGLSGTKLTLTKRERNRVLASILLARRFNLALVSSSPQVTDEKLAGEIARAQLRYREREQGLVIYMDNSHRVIGYDTMFFGTVDQVEMYTRDIVKGALLTNASAIILAHNHPSGNPKPSEADISVTRKIQAALNLVSIRLLDHLIITEGGETSFQRLGLV